MDENILRKLAKLLELKERGTEHEAEVAAERAAELMAKHSISLLDLEKYKLTDDVGEPQVGRVDDDMTARLSKKFEAWRGMLVEAIARSQGARSFRHGNKEYSLWVMGPPGSVDAVKYLYMAISKQVAALGRRNQNAFNESNAWRRAYCHGMVMRINERLQAMRAKVVSESTGTALMVITKMEVRVKERFARLGVRNARTGAQKRPDGGLYGWRDGAHVDLGGNRGALGAQKKELSDG